MTKTRHIEKYLKMLFLTQEDLLVQIKSERLDQLVDQDHSVLDDAEASAIAMVRDALFGRFDTNTIFATTGPDRPAQVIRWLRCIMLYDLAGRLPEKMVSQRLLKNYDDTLATLTDIEDGKKNTALPPKKDADTEGGLSAHTKYGWGSNAKRVHEV
jgi:Protein of unknown function (DUF1320)